jgi:hypothetical protein
MTGAEDRALVASRGGFADVLAAEEVAAAVIAVIGVLAAVSIGVMGDAKAGPDRREAFTREACRLGRGFLRTGDALPGG